MALSINNTAPTNSLRGLIPSPFGQTMSGSTPATLPQQVNPVISSGLVTPSSTANQDVKKVVTGGDGSQEVHFFPSTQPTASTATGNPNTSFMSGTDQNLINSTYAGKPAAPAAPVAPASPFGGLVNRTASVAQGNLDLGNKAEAIGAKYAPLIAAVQKGMIGQQAGDLSTGTAPVGEGNATIAANAAGQELQGLSAAQQAELAGNAQALTGQAQAQSGLAAAAGLAQPSANFPFVFNPTTGTFTVSGGNLNSAISGGVQQAITNPTLYTALDSAIASTYGTAAAGMFEQAYIAAGGNPNVAAGKAAGAQAIAAAPGQAAASNIGTTATAATQAAKDAYDSAVQKVAANTSTYSALTGVSSNLNDTLANWGNTGLITNYNSAINSIGGLTSDPNYTKFITALGNAQAAYQAALGSSGVTPTKADQDALAALNPSSSANAINAALNQLSSDAHALLIVPAYQQQQTYAQQLGL